MSKQPSPAPTVSAVGPCPTLSEMSRTPRHWKFTQQHRSIQPPLSRLDQKCLVIWNVNHLAHLISQERLPWNCALTAIPHYKITQHVTSQTRRQRC